MSNLPSVTSVALEDEDNRPTLVHVDHVRKRFVIRKDNSLKERLVTFGRGNRHREEFWALDDVNLEVKAGETLALIGHNGSGKSTLLKVIGGIIDPSSGSVSHRGRVAALLELGAGFHPDLTGRENVYLNASILGLSHEETDERLDEILTFAGIGEFIDTQIKFYSSGMYVRLAFAVAVHTDPDLLLVDEVLAVGDEAFQRKCLDKIRSFQQEGRAIILVTHNLNQVMELANRSMLLNKGKVVFDGDSAGAVAEFRNLLEGRRVAEEDAHAAALLAKDPTMTHAHGQVIGAEVHAVGRMPGEAVQPGDDIRIGVTMSHETGIDDWVCAIQIDNTMGQPVYGTTTARIGARLARLKEPQTIEFLLRDSHFGGGKYFINASLMDQAGRHLADLPQACSFDAPQPSFAVGAIYCVPEVINGHSG